MKLFKIINKLFKSEEQQAYDESYRKESIELAKKQAIIDAKQKYKDIK